MKHHHSSFKLACLFTFGALVLVQGCGDDDDANDKPDTTIPIDTGGKNTVGGKSNDSSGTANSDGGTAGSSSNSSDAGASSEGGTGATSSEGGSAGEGGTGVVEPPKCALPELGENGCFNCPTDNVTAQWLNRCVAGVNYDNAFDNATRVPLLPANGKLPPFPN